MNYESIDPIITAWAARHTLHLYKTYRDEAVRSVDLVGRDGRRYQVWIDAPDPRGNIQVHLWDYKQWRQDYNASEADLPDWLERAYATAMERLS